MLFKKNNTPAQRTASISAASLTADVANNPRAVARRLVPTVVADGMNILGNLISDGVVDFNGVIDGNIRCAAVTIRGQGVVRGEITADTVLVYGKVKGMIKAKQVQLFSGCEVDGLVMHETITIEDGARLEGKCKRMDRPYINDNVRLEQVDVESYGFEELPATDLIGLEKLRINTTN